MRGERKNTRQCETLAQYAATSECFASFFLLQYGFLFPCFNFTLFSLSKLNFMATFCLISKFFFFCFVQPVDNSIHCNARAG